MPFFKTKPPTAKPPPPPPPLLEKSTIIDTQDVTLSNAVFLFETPTFSHQSQALGRKLATTFLRQKLLYSCCTLLCPLLSVAIVGLVTLTVAHLISNIPSSETLFCSNRPLMHPLGVPLDFDPIKRPPARFNEAGFYMNSWTSTLSPKSPCVRWFGDDYPIKPPYSRDIKQQKVEGITINQQLSSDSAFMPDPVGGWLAYPDNLKQFFSQKQPDDLTPLYTDIPQISRFWAFYTEREAGIAGSRPEQTSVTTGSSSNSTNATTSTPSSGSGLLGSIPMRYYKDGPNLIPVPYFQKIENLGQADLILSQSLQKSSEQPFGMMIPPHGVWHFNEISESKLSVRLQIGTVRKFVTEQHHMGLFNDRWPRQGLRMLIALSQISSGYVRQRFPNVGITQGIRAFPKKVNPLASVDVGSMFTPLCLPFGLSFLLPIWVMQLVKDREEGMRDMLKMHGLRNLPFVAVHVAFYMLVQLIASLIVLITGLCFRLTIFTRTNPLCYLILFLLWAHVQAWMVLVFANILKRRRRAILFTVLFVFGALIIHFMSDMLSDMGSGAAVTIRILTLVHPSLSFYQVIRLLSFAASLMQPGVEPFSSWTDIFYAPLLHYYLAMIASSLLLMCIWIIQETRITWKRLWFGGDFRFLDLSRKKKDTNSEVVSEEEEEDVVKEAEMVKLIISESRRGEGEGIPPLVVNNMAKKYETGKIALRGVSFFVEKNTVFGLLGPNGAGKSTLLKVLTAQEQASFGDAFIAGSSILSDRRSIHYRIGVCPQEDHIWTDLTVYEHILFYCRLRGAPLNKAASIAELFIEGIGLSYCKFTLARCLSGGERRRLSLGISFIGKNQVIFLDEPSTGVDPESRRKIWDMLRQMKQILNATFILTTHSMEEADVLADKIGILANGKLRCIGNPIYLKKKYGSGYRLIISLKEGALLDQLEQVEALLPSSGFQRWEQASYAGSGGTTVCFEFSAKEAKIGTLILELEKNREAWSIEQCVITQTSLEDVFIRTTATTSMMDLQNPDETLIME